VSALDRERLARLLGMLGSEHEGEVVAAARQAERLRRQAGATWFEILASPSPSAPPHGAPVPAEVAEMLVMWGAHENCCLSPWERDFLASMREWRSLPTPRQLAVVLRTARRIARCRR
jgi:hypothetical protein